MNTRHPTRRSRGHRGGRRHGGDRRHVDWAVTRRLRDRAGTEVVIRGEQRAVAEGLGLAGDLGPLLCRTWTSKAWAAKRNRRGDAEAMGPPGGCQRRFRRRNLLYYGCSNQRRGAHHGGRCDPPVDDRGLRGLPTSRTSTSTRTSRSVASAPIPAVRQVTFPPNATLGLHSHPCDTLYVIQSGEFIVDGEGSYRPGELRWVKAGVAYGPERAGARRYRAADRVDERTVRPALGARGQLMVLVAADLATERPDEVALRDDAVTIGWGQVNDTLNRVVNGLAELDLGPDRRVAVLAENSVETVLAHLGGLLAGASTVPVNFHLNADEVTYILEDSGARVLFVGPETADDRHRSGATRRRASRDRVADGRSAGRHAMGDVARGGVDRRAADRGAAASEPDVHVRHDGPAEGRRAPADDVRRRRHDGRARRGAGAERVRGLRHAPRRRADVPHRSAVGRPAAGRRYPRRRARPLRRRRCARRQSTPIAPSRR